MTDELTIADAIEAMVSAAHALPGEYFAQIAIRYRAGFPPSERWECEVAADIKGDDGDMFRINGPTLQSVVESGIREAWRRAGGSPV